MTQQAKPVLLIEDTPSLMMLYEAVLKRAGHAVHGAATAKDGLRALDRIRPDVVVLDLMLPDRDGLDLIEELLAHDDAPHVIVITAYGSISKAVSAMRAGAHEFLVKPFDEHRFLSAVTNALKTRRRGSAHRNRTDGPPQPAGGLIGHSEPMQEVYSRIRSIASSMATAFITGDSGTGKELCAHAIHDLSNRATGPFIALNCGAIPHDLMESEVFGHLRGAFTGAIADKKGAALEADGGTLFLDEICEMDMTLQTKLLRFLQTSSVQPVGAAHPRNVDVRIICATNRDPMEAVRSGRFREDLYYRLHVVPIHMPPLRARGDDVIEIAEQELTRLAREEGRAFKGLTPEVTDIFRNHPWPGNVRQLLNVLRNVVVLHDGEAVTPQMLPRDLLPDTATPGPTAGNGVFALQDSDGPAPPGMPDDLIGQPLAEIERIIIERTIAHYGGSIPKAARVLEVAPSTLYRKRDAWLRSGRQ